MAKYTKRQRLHKKTRRHGRKSRVVHKRRISRSNRGGGSYTYFNTTKNPFGKKTKVGQTSNEYTQSNQNEINAARYQTESKRRELVDKLNIFNALPNADKQKMSTVNLGNDVTGLTRPSADTYNTARL